MKVAYSPNEGYWNNDIGWGDLSRATRFQDTEAQYLALPNSTGEEPRWIDDPSENGFDNYRFRTASLSARIDGLIESADERRKDLQEMLVECCTYLCNTYGAINSIIFTVEYAGRHAANNGATKMCRSVSVRCETAAGDVFEIPHAIVEFLAGILENSVDKDIVDTSYIFVPGDVDLRAIPPYIKG